MRIGVLALQGGFAPHVRALLALGHEAPLVRTARALDELDGLVLPGGESTTMLRLIAGEGLEGPLRAFVASGRPVLATCAGLVLAARVVRDPEQPGFGWLPVTVRRNAWGRQLASGVARSDDGRLRLVLIRAPRIAETGGAEVLATLDGEPVLVRSGRVVGATFHPELTDELSVHAMVFS